MQRDEHDRLSEMLSALTSLVRLPNYLVTLIGTGFCGSDGVLFRLLWKTNIPPSLRPPSSFSPSYLGLWWLLFVYAILLYVLCIICCNEIGYCASSSVKRGVVYIFYDEDGVRDFASRN